MVIFQNNVNAILNTIYNLVPFIVFLPHRSIYNFFSENLKQNITVLNVEIFCCCFVAFGGRKGLVCP